MNLRRIGLLAVLGVGGAFGFGILATIVLDIVWPRERAPVVAAVVSPPMPAAEPAAEAAPAAPPAQMSLASVSSKPVKLDQKPVQTAIGSTEVRPVKVKTIQMVLTNPEPETTTTMAYAAPAPSTPNPASVALMPKPRPATREAAAPKPAAKHRPSAEDEQLVLSEGQIGRFKKALALTPDQEAYWPAIAAELSAIGRKQPKRSATRGAAPKLQVDDDSVQRLYAAATPLIMRLRDDQKRTVRQLAMMLGLQEVAQAL